MAYVYTIDHSEIKILHGILVTLFNKKYDSVHRYGPKDDTLNTGAAGLLTCE